MEGNTCKSNGNGHVGLPLSNGVDANDVSLDKMDIKLKVQNSSSEKFDDSLLSGSHDGKYALPGDALLGRKDDGCRDTAVTMDTTGKCIHKDTRRGKCWSSVYSWLRKNEYLVLILGSVTFLVGCTALVIGVYMMYAGRTCQYQSSTHASPETNLTSPVQSTLTKVSPAIEGHFAYTNTTDIPSYNMTSQLPVTNATEAVIRGENMALGRPAYQSSTLVEGGVPYDAILATDGSKQFMFSSGSCSRTAMETRPFWYVDLGSLELVKTVKIIVPRDVPAGELHNFEVRIGQDEELSANPLCRYYMGTALIFRILIRCQRPMYGRYVSVELLGDATRPMNRLTLCEVQVYNN